MCPPGCCALQERNREVNAARVAERDVRTKVEHGTQSLARLRAQLGELGREIGKKDKEIEGLHRKLREERERGKRASEVRGRGGMVTPVLFQLCTCG